MNVKQLIQLLKLYPADTEVLVFDPEVSFTVPVTGMIFDESADTLELTSDDPC